MIRHRMEHSVHELFEHGKEIRNPCVPFPGQLGIQFEKIFGFRIFVLNFDRLYRRRMVQALGQRHQTQHFLSLRQWRLRNEQQPVGLLYQYLIDCSATSWKRLRNERFRNQGNGTDEPMDPRGAYEGMIESPAFRRRNPSMKHVCRNGGYQSKRHRVFLV